MYFTLMSDSSRKIFPNNRIGNFKVKLPHKYQYDRHKFEIGLSFISYPNNLYNIVDGRFKVRITMPYESTLARTGNRDYREVFRENTAAIKLGIESGFYGSIGEVLDAINTQLANARFKFSDPETASYNAYSKYTHFVYDHFTEKVQFKYQPVYALPEGDQPIIQIRFSNELGAKLGFALGEFGPNWVDIDEIGHHTSDLNLGRSAIFVYCDILEAGRVVGNTITKLLSVIPVIGSHGSTAYFQPNFIEYCNLAYDSFDEIEISLRNDRGEILQFNSGKVCLTIHIKEKF